MSLEQAIRHGKERRRPYQRSQRSDASCRPHGGCPYCAANRSYRSRVRSFTAEEWVRELAEEGRPQVLR